MAPTSQSLTPVLDYELQRRIQDELDPAESVIWIGQPVPRFLGGNVPAQLVTATFFAIFSSVWLLGIGSSQGPIVYYAFAAVGVCSVIAMLGMPITSYLQTSRTIYAITDRRALIVEPGRRKSVHSFGPTELAAPLRRDRGNELGDVVFKEEWLLPEPPRTQPWATLLQPWKREYGFINIRDPRQVEHLILELARPSAAPPVPLARKT